MKLLKPLTLGLVIAVTGISPGNTFAAELVVGQVGPMSGLEASQGRAYSAGMQLHFNAVNQAGGVNGHTFRLVRRDDGGKAEETVNLTKKMLAEDQPMILAGYFGSRNVSEVLSSNLLAKEGIPLVGYRSAQKQVDSPLLYSTRADVTVEVRKFAEHLATLGITKLGLLYEDGPGAPALTKAVEESAARVRATVVARGSYRANSTNVRSAVNTLLEASPQAIILLASGAAAAGFIEQYRAGGGVAQLFANSAADIEQLSKRLSEEQMQGVAIAQVTPNPYSISSRLSKEFGDAVVKTPNLHLPVSYAMLEGYINARVIVEAVRRQGRKPTREGTRVALDHLENFDLGGYVVNFRPDVHIGSRFVELSIVTSSGKIRQ